MSDTLFQSLPQATIPATTPDTDCYIRALPNQTLNNETLIDFVCHSTPVTNRGTKENPKPVHKIRLISKPLAPRERLQLLSDIRVIARLCAHNADTKSIVTSLQTLMNAPSYNLVLAREQPEYWPRGTTRPVQDNSARGVLSGVTADPFAI